MKKNLFALISISALLLFSACSDSNEKQSNQTPVTPADPESKYTMMYIVSEGQKGSNTASLDVFNFKTGVYSNDVYAEINSEVIKNLGDIANDIQVHGDYAYVAVNGSHKVEVMYARTAKRKGQIEVQYPRFIALDGKKAYVSSTHSIPKEGLRPSELDSVYEVDLERLEVTKGIHTGRNPEGLAVANGKLYVANSGGFDFPNYETTVSVIDLESFEEIEKIEVGPNPGKVVAHDGLVFVHMQGNYGDVPSSLIIIDSKTDKHESYPINMNKFAIANGKVYFYDAPYGGTPSYGIFDIESRKLTEESFVSEEASAKILLPYGIAVNDSNGEIFITDSPDFTIDGYLHCIKEAEIKWSTKTGNVPASMAFVK